MSAILPEGKHKFSGIDPFQYQGEYGQNHDGYYVIIDDVVYAFEIDHDDGWRSYGEIYIPEKISVHDIKNRFPAQEVIIMQQHGNYIDENKQFYSIIDVVTRKTILELGTDYIDSYYPLAICHYYPENMAINQQQSNVTNTSDNNYTNEWVITSTGASGDYQIDENITYIYN